MVTLMYNNNLLAKSGIPPKDVVEFASCIVNECEYLNLVGLMTIGEARDSAEENINPDFVVSSILYIDHHNRDW